jgi:prefoldin subunit 5
MATSATNQFLKTRFVLPSEPMVNADISRALYTKTQDYIEHKICGGSYCAVCFENKPYRYTHFCRVCDKGVCGGCMKGLIRATPSYELHDQETIGNDRELPKCPLCRAEGCFAPQGKRYSRLRGQDDNNGYYMADITLDKILRRYVDDLNKEVSKYELSLEEAEKQKKEVEDYNKRQLERQERKNMKKKIESLEKLRDDLYQQIADINSQLGQIQKDIASFDQENMKEIPKTKNALSSVFRKNHLYLGVEELPIVDYGDMEQWGNSHRQVRYRYVQDDFMRGHFERDLYLLPMNLRIAYGKVRTHIQKLCEGELSVVLPRKVNTEKILKSVEDEEDIDAMIATLQERKKMLKRKFVMKKK